MPDGDNDIPDHLGDSADRDDTNTFEILSRGAAVPPTAATNLDPPNTTLSSAPPPEDGIGTGMGAETPHPDALAIVRFPDGCPGAPLAVDQGLSAYEATYNTLGEMVWAPFRSQRDWEVARWAKMRGPSSTAMTELLTIPEVRNCQHIFSLSNRPFKGH